jgi:hypothetical protein
MVDDNRSLGVAQRRRLIGSASAPAVNSDAQQIAKYVAALSIGIKGTR